MLCILMLGAPGLLGAHCRAWAQGGHLPRQARPDSGEGKRDTNQADEGMRAVDRTAQHSIAETEHALGALPPPLQQHSRDSTRPRGPVCPPYLTPLYTELHTRVFVSGFFKVNLSFKTAKTDKEKQNKNNKKTGFFTQI